MKSLRKSEENHEAQLPNFTVFIGQNPIFRRYCIQHVKDGIQFRVYKINNESIAYFSYVYFSKS